MALALVCAIVFVSVPLMIEFTEGHKGRYLYPSPSLIRSNADHSKYVQSRFREKALGLFNDEDSRTKVLIIGDSYGADLTNIVYESSLIKKYQISTHHISSLCGNLFLSDYSVIRHEVHPHCLSESSGLIQHGYYSDPRLLALIHAADEIWLSSSWQSWQIKYLEKSIGNIRQITEAEIYTFSTKFFEVTSPKEMLLNTSPIERVKLVFVMDANIRNLNLETQRASVNGNFVDLSYYYCGDETCRLFDDDGNLLSYDGSHLTREGAVFFGRKISADILGH